MAIALFMSAIDSTIVAVGLRDMQEDLNAKLGLVGWTMTGYLLTQIVVLPAAGKLGDDFDRKKIFLWAVGTFTVCSIMCGLAQNIYMLIIFRVLQAVGAGAFIPLCSGIIAEAFGEKRQTPIGLFNSIYPLGAILGPNVGGVIIDHLSWRWTFFVNGPIGIILLVAGLQLIPGIQGKPKGKSLDKIGMALFAAGMVSILVGLTHWSTHPQDTASPYTWGFVGSGLALLYLFVQYEGRAKAPVIELGLLRDRSFMASSFYSFLQGAAIFGYFSLLPYYAIVGLGMSASTSGLILTPRSVMALIVTTMVSFRLARLGYRKPIVLGTLLFALSLLLVGLGAHEFTTLGIYFSQTIVLAGKVMIAGIGLGLMIPSVANAAMDPFPTKIGTAAGMRGMFSNTGAILGGTGVILALSHFDNKEAGLRHIYLGLCFISLIGIPMAFLIKERGKKPSDWEPKVKTAPAEAVAK